MFRLSCILLSVLSLLSAADKRQPASGQSSNDAVALNATVYFDQESLQKLVGSDLQGAVAVVELRVTPKTEDPLMISWDDFTLRSENDGQRSQPFAPSQIAGSAALVVSQRGSGGGLATQSNGPVWGGVGGGAPQRLPGSGGGVGNSGSETSAQASVQDASNSKDSPLLRTLKEKVLPEKKISEPASGLLYFQLEGKHKPKDLVLEYRTNAGKVVVRFK